MDKLRSIIREGISEVFNEEFFNEEIFNEEIFNEEIFNEEIFNEERISNKVASEEVENRRNFIGSHTYGEDLGDLGKMYAAYSYGEHHPLYVWDGERWYHNNEPYILPNGKANKWTTKHLMQLRPNNETQGRPTSFLVKMLSDFKRKHGIGDNTHTDLAPGEK